MPYLKIPPSFLPETIAKLVSKIEQELSIKKLKDRRNNDDDVTYKTNINSSGGLHHYIDDILRSSLVDILTDLNFTQSLDSSKKKETGWSSSTNNRKSPLSSSYLLSPTKGTSPVTRSQLNSVSPNKNQDMQDQSTFSSRSMRKDSSGYETNSYRKKKIRSSEAEKTNGDPLTSSIVGLLDV